VDGAGYVSRTAYFDCFAGAAGDMVLGALMHCGVPPERLREMLAGLDIGEWRLDAESVTRSGIGSLRVRVSAPPEAGQGRHLPEIEKIIGGAGLDAEVAESAVRVFRRLAEAEARVHRADINRLHFHEVGALDAIVDIVGTCALLHELGVGKVVASPLPMGHGFVECMHGVIPLPPPAVVELTRGVPVYGAGIEGELVTPTGAALLTTLAESFGVLPRMAPVSIGYGAGTREFPDRPNLLRVIVGEEAQPQSDDDVAIVETNIDDMSPQFYDVVMDRLFSAGALDVLAQPVQMKKNRPGTLVTVVCRPDGADRLAAILFAETTTLGVRMWRAGRRCMGRCVVPVTTEYGTIRVKVAEWGDSVRKAMPEYEDVRRLSEAADVPARVVWESAMAGYRTQGEQ